MSWKKLAKSVWKRMRTLKVKRPSPDAKLGRLAQQLYAAYAAGEGATRDFSGIITDIRDDRV